MLRVHATDLRRLSLTSAGVKIPWPNNLSEHINLFPPLQLRSSWASHQYRVIKYQSTVAKRPVIKTNRDRKIMCWHAALSSLSHFILNNQIICIHWPLVQLRFLIRNIYFKVSLRKNTTRTRPVMNYSYLTTKKKQFQHKSLLSHTTMRNFLHKK